MVGGVMKKEKGFSVYSVRGRVECAVMVARAMRDRCVEGE